MINFENYIFFVIFIPFIVGGLLVLSRYRDEKYRYHRFFLICLILLIGHFLLPYFEVGIFPTLVNDPLFYLILFLLGMGFTIIYMYIIEDTSFKEIGWKSAHPIKDFSVGLLYALIILVLSALLELPFLSPTLPQFSVLKLITVICFAAGAIYEECLFRGILQTCYLKNESLKDYQIILIQALAFLSINLFYFPFDAFGLINYLIMFLMSLIVGYLALKYSLISSSTAHFLFVLLAGLLS